MTLRQLRIFAAVARLGSFSRAAEELQISQPSVSIQVADLERVLGVDLFTQEGRRAHLTGAGRVLDEYARRILALVDDAEADRKSTRLNSSHITTSYAVFCLKKKTSPWAASTWSTTVVSRAAPRSRRTRSPCPRSASIRPRSPAAPTSCASPSPRVSPSTASW